MLFEATLLTSGFEVESLQQKLKDQFGKEVADKSSSNHFYTEDLPNELQSSIDSLRYKAEIKNALRAQFGATAVVTPFPVTDEVYISHPNLDFAGDHGLYAPHYDGHSRFIHSFSTVRALIYLESDGQVALECITSGKTMSPSTGDVLMIDFDKEYHDVHLGKDAGKTPRIILKCQYLVAPKSLSGTSFEKAYQFLHRAVFFGVKTAMEYTKTPDSIVKRVMGLLVNNGYRLLNNVHWLLPVIPTLALVALVVMNSKHFLAYNIYMVARCSRPTKYSQELYLASSIAAAAHTFLLLKLLWVQDTNISTLTQFSLFLCFSVLLVQVALLGFSSVRLSRQKRARSSSLLHRFMHGLQFQLMFLLLTATVLFGSTWRMTFVIVGHLIMSQLLLLVDGHSDTIYRRVFAPVPKKDF